MSEVLELAANALRGVIIAPPERKLVVADLSNIEGRVLAWLAGEDWKVQAFREFDAGQGADLYQRAYAKAFGILPEAVTKDQRQIGKVLELSMGYEGGVGAFVTMAAGYGLDLEALASAAWPHLPAWALDEARDFLEWRSRQARAQHAKRIARGVAPADAEAQLQDALKRSRLGLSEQVFLVCDALKRLWRHAHPAIANRDHGLWTRLEGAAISATNEPEKTFRAGRLAVLRTGNWLRVLLPSGRSLCYASPRLDEAGRLTYMGTNPHSRKWQRLHTYGGKVVENATQAVARDVMARAMPRVEAAGYAIVLTVHDELVTEAPDTPEFNAAQLSALLAAGEPWTEGLPLAAAGFEAHRYRKG